MGREGSGPGLGGPGEEHSPRERRQCCQGAHSLAAARGPLGDPTRGSCPLCLPQPCPKHLREDQAGLHTTAELLQVRVQSLTHILCMQEEELARRVGPWPRPLAPGCPLCVGGVGVPLLEPACVFP